MHEAVLILADGTVFRGISIGLDGVAIGEIVFNTSMTGYQEILTDPSYAQQLITFTYPHIGNTGVNPKDEESGQIFAKGVVIRSLSPIDSNFRSTGNFSDYLIKHKIVAISEIDTRHLTSLIRSQGHQVGVIMTGGQINVKSGIKQAKNFGLMSSKGLALQVSCQKTYSYDQGTRALGDGLTGSDCIKYKVVVYDFGAKKNILRSLVSRGCKLIIVPANTVAEEVLALKPDGICLSNGPGNPESCAEAITAIQIFLTKQIPLLGICLGHQLLALALGGGTKKMKFGHRGSNHPVIDLRTKRVAITSQNHGFVVDETSLPKEVEITHLSLFDNSLQGFTLKDKPVVSFQGHPEANPGPQDIDVVFDRFIYDMQQH